MWLPDVSEVCRVHEGLVALFIQEDDPVSPAGVKSQIMLESACSRPFTGAGQTDKYDTLYRKTAALFHSLTKNHPFHNGNKRTALVTVLRTLDRNGRRLSNTVTDDDLFDFVVSITSDEYPHKEHQLNTDEVVEEISKWLKSKTVPSGLAISGMTSTRFVEKCKLAGASYKLGKSGLHCLSNAGGSVSYSRKTRQLDGNVIRQYLKRLHLNEAVAGFTVGEFQHGTTTEREQIYRYISTLKKLAKT